jgi:hypothetical protein
MYFKNSLKHYGNIRFSPALWFIIDVDDPEISWHGTSMVMCGYMHFCIEISDNPAPVFAIKLLLYHYVGGNDVQ